MKKNLLFLILTIFTTLYCFAQSQFQFAVGGTNNDYANSIIQTTDGGYAVTGYTNSFGNGNDHIYIVKISQSARFSGQKP